MSWFRNLCFDYTQLVMRALGYVYSLFLSSFRPSFNPSMSAHLSPVINEASSWHVPGGWDVFYNLIWYAMLWFRQRQLIQHTIRIAVFARYSIA